MKRGRETLEESQRGALPFSMQLEIIHGLTRARATEFDTARRAAQEIFYDRASDCCRHVNLATLLCSGNEEGVVAADWSRKVCRALVSHPADTSAGPLQIETVQLVANENTSLIFAQPIPSTTEASSSSLSGATMQVKVGRTLGEQVYPGDVVLLCTASTSGENQEEGAMTGATSSLEAAHVEFVALNGLYLTDFEEWREAVSHNAACVTRWLSHLSAHAPGIAQLTQMHVASMGEGATHPVMSGWARSLQLPLLLQVNKALQPSLDAKATEKLRRLILSTLRLYVNLFTRAPSLVSTEYWYRNLFCEFVASPLCVAGFSMAWPTSAGTMISSAWDAVVRSLADFLDFSLLHVCMRGTQYMHRQTALEPTSSPTTNHPHSAAQVETPAFLEKRAVGAIALILHRISGIALQHVQAHQLWVQQQAHRENSEASFTSPSPTSAAHAHELVYHALEGMGHAGLLHRVAHWLQQAESTQGSGSGAGAAGTGGGGGGLHALLDRVCSPPSQQDVEELFALKSETVWEQMQVMQKTYTPYLSHDATRFVEAMALAAYAELYGPSARAAQVLFTTRDASSRADMTAMLSRRGVCAARVSALTQPALSPDLLLTSSLLTVRHMAAYGLPVHLSLHDDVPTAASAATTTTGTSAPSVTSFASLQALLKATTLEPSSGAASQSADGVEGSVAVLIAIRLQGRPILFPAILTRLTLDVATETNETEAMTATATVYVQREGDLLADFLDTSAGLTEGEDWDGAPDAWLVASSRADMTVPGESPTAWGRGRPTPGGHGNAHRQQRQEPPVLAEPHRLLPRGMAALSYQDLIERLSRLRGELQRVETVPTATSSLSLASSSTATAEAWRRVGGLWLHYFASRQAPSQLYTKSLSGGASATLTGGGGNGKQEATRVLHDAATAASFTPPQVAVLHTMSEVSLPTSSRGDGSHAHASIKVLEGARGSGKTSVLYASGMVRGEVHRLARKEHQDSALPIIKKATATVKTLLTRSQQASSLRDLYADDAMVDLPEEVAEAAIGQMNEYVRLNEGLHYCTVPLLVRPYFTSRMTSCVPPAVEKRLFSAPLDATKASAVLVSRNVASVSTVVEEAVQRCRKAPLTQALLGRLSTLRQLGDLCSQLAIDDEDGAGDEPPRLCMSLLPLVMSAREVAETVKAATQATWSPGDNEETPTTVGMTWQSYIVKRLWPDVETLATSVDDSGAATTTTKGTATWALPVATRKPFAPVMMPETMHITELSVESRRGWSAVYRDEQRDLLPLLRTHIQEATKHVCRLFYELVTTMAAVSQTAKYSLVSTSQYELTQGLHLPFLWAWRPLTVLVDDLEAVSDGFLSVLPPANHLTVSLCSTSPSHTERNRQLPMMLLKEIEHAVPLVTAVLHERLRCPKPEIQETLKQLCGNGDLHNAPFNEYALNAKRRREIAAAKAAASAAQEDDGGEDSPKPLPSTMGRGVTTVTDAARDGADLAPGPSAEEPTELKPLSFRGLVSASPVEVWSHAVPAALGEAADHAAAHFLQRYLASYGVTSCQVITAFPPSLPTATTSLSAQSTSTCLPFFGGAEASYVEECDVAIVCLTSLALRAVTMEQRRRVRRDDRGRPWMELQRAKEGLFAQRLQHWLWHTVACARVGVMLVGSSELFTHVPLLRGLEAFALHHRCQVPLMASQKYWLPEGVESGVLALRCPAHDKCRRTAAVHVEASEKDLDMLLLESERDTTARAEDEEGANEASALTKTTLERITPRVDIRGAHQCLSLCLQGYDTCDRRSHACLMPCHTQLEPLESMPSVHIASAGRAALPPEAAVQPHANSSDTQAHGHCPFPCCKPLPCGHLCSKACGDACEPCTFTGLRELSCGQRVISGVNNNQEITYEVFHHFQKEAPCGSQPRVCEVAVSVPCPRCGVKTSIPCYEVTASASRARVAAGEQSKNATPEPAPEFSLPETECIGCVSVYNKVAQELGYPTLPVPPSVRPSQPPHGRRSDPAGSSANPDEDAVSDRDVEDVAAAAALPRHTLSTEAQEKLRAEFAKAAQKMRLRGKAEALNISCGRTTDEIDFVRFKKEYDANRSRLAQQEQAHQEKVKASVSTWEQRLRKDITAQVQLNAELETMVPLLVNEAEREAARQQDFPY